MSAKEKAKELLDKYSFVYIPNYTSNFEIKQAAIIAVDEIIEQWDYIDTYLADGRGELNPNLKWWHEVKSEIEKLK